MNMSSDMLRLRKAIEERYETAPEDRHKTQLVYAGSGVHERDMEFATYRGSAIDCEGDEVPFVVQWFKSPHFEVCQLFNGGAHGVLWSEGGVISHEFARDE